MAEGKATTIRFSSAMYERLEEAGELTGLPINSIVVVACLEWLDAHQPLQPASGQASIWPGLSLAPMQRHWKAPSWRRSVYPFDRFTERAKHALTLAQEEATRAGDGSIEPAHLLNALAGDPNALAGRALAGIGVERATLRAETATAPAAPDVPGAAGLPTSDTRRVIEAAFREAKQQGDAHVGTAHLLLGLLAERESGAAALLERLGAPPDQLRSAVLELKRDNPHLG
jgi:ClpA/ClpB-like protein